MQEHDTHIKEHELVALLQAAGLTAQEKLKELSEKEAADLTAWLKKNPHHRDWKNKLSDKEHFSQLLLQYRSLQKDQHKEWEKFRYVNAMKPAAMATIHRVHFLRKWGWAAAIILLLGGVGIWYQLSQSSRLSFPQGISPAAAGVDIAPGSNKAVLTIGDNKIVLAGNKTGISINNDITYTDGEKLFPDSPVIPVGNFMQLITPKGGQYQAVLPDGSKVWLNAASSIKFPAQFTGAQRKVEVSGEVYMEIVTNTRQPFIVSVNDMEVKVLGTSFNINAYENEAAVKTTLVEGSVKIKTEGKEALLRPGQQAEVTDNRNFIKVNNNINLDQTLAWKNGYFNLQDMSVQEVAKQLERWYDIAVKYEGDISERKFSGKFSRGVRLSTVLNWLSESGIYNRLEGRTFLLSEKPLQ